MNSADADIRDESKKKAGKSTIPVNVKTVASKFRTKREVYFFVTVVCKCYLPPYENVTTYHLRNLLNGSKKS